MGIRRVPDGIASKPIPRRRCEAISNAIYAPQYTHIPRCFPLRDHHGDGASLHGSSGPSILSPIRLADQILKALFRDHRDLMPAFPFMVQIQQLLPFFFGLPVRRLLAHY
jgi:hypothetical protein